MTHIWGPPKWWNAIFNSYEYKNNELFLYLSDGTTRKMDDWGDDTLKTLENLRELKTGDAIRVATWGQRKETEWFCDVEKI